MIILNLHVPCHVTQAEHVIKLEEQVVKLKGQERKMTSIQVWID